ncbi:hypothetical protein Cob_v011299 [Colletotrichum orbiculare MAFF 240422]|uniref:Uncharacterized protein n=1 Tax=Colletotrichum orbiculare (strain 104-T / ATCC 96160 / CBS 514.97 / LARS 414 / MAFF 240422) TaxID=1213857 RepID=A0A484FE53_COLOR|nr:hypothetical protein Cob_v011299 [Colletotrichum orbiculare MAFF 240422]
MNLQHCHHCTTSGIFELSINWAIEKFVFGATLRIRTAEKLGSEINRALPCEESLSSHVQFAPVTRDSSLLSQMRALSTHVLNVQASGLQHTVLRISFDASGFEANEMGPSLASRGVEETTSLIGCHGACSLAVYGCTVKLSIFNPDYVMGTIGQTASSSHNIG